VPAALDPDHPAQVIDRALAAVRDRIGPHDDGAIADYIPELAAADPEHFGIALVSVDGNGYGAGDVDVGFTIQSISKPFVYALALADHGLDAVAGRVGLEPSGEAYNAISLDPDDGRPDNPMINAGAIVTASLVRAADADERFERVRETLSAFAGRDLSVNERVFASEAATGDRNRALAHLMKAAGALDLEVEDALDVYFRQCSLMVTATDVATMAATLARSGHNPVTDHQVVDEQVAEHVLAVMATCGMYDASGRWLVRVGLPAKSGVAGGVLAVSPGQFGIGTFSPRLDDRGNSVRGVAACEALSSEFSLHLLHRVERSEPVVAVHRAPEVPDGVTVLRLRGALEFTGAERALRALDPAESHIAPTATLVIDLRQVLGCHPVAAAMLDALTLGQQAAGVKVVVLDPRRRGLVPAATEVDHIDALDHDIPERVPADPMS